MDRSTVAQAPPFPPADAELCGQFQALSTLQKTLRNLPVDRGLIGLRLAERAQADLGSTDEVWRFAAGCGVWARFGQVVGVGAALWFAAQPANGVDNILGRSHQRCAVADQQITARGARIKWMPRHRKHVAALIQSCFSGD